MAAAMFVATVDDVRALSTPSTESRQSRQTQGWGSLGVRAQVVAVAVSVLASDVRRNRGRVGRALELSQLAFYPSNQLKLRSFEPLVAIHSMWMDCGFFFSSLVFSVSEVRL
jgi:hypothetical protein